MSLRVLNNTPTISEQEDHVGGLSNPSKMPGHGWSISAFHCNVGSKLRHVPGSTCSHCYAMKGRYTFSTVQNAHENRLNAYNKNPELWKQRMIDILNRKAENKKRLAKKKARRTKKKCEDYTVYFRWFDSGDLQSLDMLLDINDIAHATPGVAHWLPSREYGILRTFAKLMKSGDVKLAPNLTIRVSAVKVGEAVKGKYKLPFPTSRVGKQVNKTGNCDAYTRGGECGPCRACWNRKIPVITYPLH